MPMILHTYGVGNVAATTRGCRATGRRSSAASWKYADLDVAKRKAAANGR